MNMITAESSWVNGGIEWQDIRVIQNQESEEIEMEN